MRRPFLLLLVAFLALGACRIGLGGDEATEAAPSAMATDAIEVTPLDGPAAVPAADPAAAMAPDAGAPPLPPSPDPAAGAEIPAAIPAAAEPPPVVKSPSQIACEKRKGSYVKVKSLFTCVKTPRDAGKRCSRDSDCSGHCLARSQTCAPFDPLIGCNDILDDEGRRITLCLD
ncbi:hypothetical protein [Rhodobacter sp. CZR27]|uniref:hypothetical protein n=1 Tax=Rhodobacter sp. CZR27 TaxID=2033869 RepID=UPI000BBF1F10|nr:hypothetical protein [Rhodobacter sp. CZR27]